jgi:hypothetical protein
MQADPPNLSHHPLSEFPTHSLTPPEFNGEQWSPFPSLDSILTTEVQEMPFYEIIIQH